MDSGGLPASFTFNSCTFPGMVYVNQTVNNIVFNNCLINSGTPAINAPSSTSVNNIILNGCIFDAPNIPFIKNVTVTGVSKMIDCYVSKGSLPPIPPSATPSLSANPPVSGTAYQNTNPYAIEIDLPVYVSTGGTVGYVTIAKGSTDTPTAIGNQYVSGDTSSTATQIIRVKVPAGWYYKFTGSGVTFATATPFAE